MMPTPNPYAGARPHRKSPTWWYLFVGLVTLAFGLLPWMLTGMRLPLQNLWAADSLPGDMPRALLPFSQYDLSLILSMVILGTGLAGLAVRAVPAAARPRAAAYAATGALGASALAAIQSGTVVRNGLQDTLQAAIYFYAVLAVIVVAALIGLLALLLLALGKPPAASIGATAVALALAIWLRTLVVLPGNEPPLAAMQSLLGAARWLPLVLVGLAMAWCGIGTIRQGLAWLASLLLLWVVPAVLDGLATAAGSRALAGNLGEMAVAGARAMLRSLGPTGGSLGEVTVALVVAIGGVFALRAVAAGKSASSLPS
ncbi:hypothetical protein ACIPVK_17685 [Paeniglutamicibacter sp. MACA_103]|uniref:hypothetical protein n=1 Tax=Paeniglutamicibacter sp. MACA_103 TaxID=3377337 RepID=UPI0038948173